MGIIITKFKKKKTTYEILEQLENEIQYIEEFRRSTEQSQKRTVGRFICISICVYCIMAFIFYFYFFPEKTGEGIAYIIPFIVLPVLLLFIKRILTWYYNRKISKKQSKLSTLKNEKKKILEEVMDKETYKVAKTILEMFAPEQVKRSTSLHDFTPAKSKSPTLAALPQTGLRYRGQLPNTVSRSISQGLSSQGHKSENLSSTLVPKTLFNPQTPVQIAGRPNISGTPLLLPRAILPRDRSVLDKMVDYLVGDGPSNRYALICKSCCSHNGMALKEEFDYLSFKCCYCSTFNPSRKKRPIAPKLVGSPRGSPSKSNQSLEFHEFAQNSATDSESESDVVRPRTVKVTVTDKISSFSDSDKLSDFEIKSSDTESSVMDVDQSPSDEVKPEVHTSDSALQD